MRAIHICWFEVIFVGESQGGHVASMAAVEFSPDALILVSSLPDSVVIPQLTSRGVTIGIGWKVGMCLWRKVYIITDMQHT